jgi:uncharacterized protein
MKHNPGDYRERTYRNNILKNDLNVYNLTIRETDLFISTDHDLKEIAKRSVLQLRAFIESYISAYPNFLTSLIPLKYDAFAPEIVREMMLAAIQTGVGPMAAVAGAIAEHVGRDLLMYSKNVIIENGGDIFIQASNDVHVGIFAGSSPLSERVSVLVRREEMPIGVCTSSGTVGHSLSFGCADAVCVKAKSASLADAAATAVGNLVKSKRNIHQVLENGMTIEEVKGIVIIVDDQLGAIGDIELLKG